MDSAGVPSQPRKESQMVTTDGIYPEQTLHQPLHQYPDKSAPDKEMRGLSQCRKRRKWGGGKREDKPGFSPQTHTFVSCSDVSSLLNPILITGVSVSGILKCL